MHLTRAATSQAVMGVLLVTINKLHTRLALVNILTRRFRIISSTSLRRHSVWILQQRFTLCNKLLLAKNSFTWCRTLHKKSAARRYQALTLLHSLFAMKQATLNTLPRPHLKRNIFVL